jgi:hypothetical protein
MTWKSGENLPGVGAQLSTSSYLKEIKRNIKVGLVVVLIGAEGCCQSESVSNQHTDFRISLLETERKAWRGKKSVQGFRLTLYELKYLVILCTVREFPVQYLKSVSREMYRFVNATVHSFSYICDVLK